MPKLVLMVSESIPDLPESLAKEKGLTVRRVRKFAAQKTDGDDIVAWLFDDKFLTRNESALRSAALAPGSVLAWNPGGEAPLPDILPGEALFDEVFSFKSPAYFLRTVRNLFRALLLSGELAHKEELLRAKESENSELLEVGIALSAERDNNKLLEYILKQVRHIARADAGTLYLLEKSPGHRRAADALQDHAE